MHEGQSLGGHGDPDGGGGRSRRAGPVRWLVKTWSGRVSRSRGDRGAAPGTALRGRARGLFDALGGELPGAFTDSDNLVVGPLVLIGGAFTDARTVRDFGGNKFPLLVKAGHSVTVRIARPAHELAGLAYGPLPQGETTLDDTYRSVTFVACRAGEATRRYSPDGPSASYADEVSVTFWSGFVLARAPACIPLQVYMGDSPSPEHVGLALGRRGNE